MSKFTDAMKAPAPMKRNHGPMAPSRQGRKHVGAYVAPDVARRLRMIAASEDSSVQQLIEEGIEMLFQSRGNL
jgi:predicted HicB family RNase H-like nuclease